MEEDYYFICLVDSVCVPSTCSFLRCFATCSAVGKEQLHFGHVKPVSDIMSDWTILNKKHTSVCYSLIQIAQQTCLSSSLCLLSKPNTVVSSRRAIMINGTEYSVKKLWHSWINAALAIPGKADCLRFSGIMPPMPIATSTISTSAMIFLFWHEITTTTTLFQRNLR